jgi:hypothetical protein
MAPLLVTKIAVFALSTTWPALAVYTATMRREQPRIGGAASSALFTSSGKIMSSDPIEDGINDWCDDDFPLGQSNANCAKTPTEQKLTKAECEEAMIQARAAFKNNNTALFEIPIEYFHNYPEGCFSKTEDEGCEPYGVCYYYNECAGDQCGGAHDGTQINETGTPVCKRVKIEHGTSGTSAGCPNGYDNIKDEDTCSVLAACLADCQGGSEAVTGGVQFRINIVNASKYHDHPKWCFIDPSDGCAYFNAPLASDGSAMPDPKNPHVGGGTPLCNVTTITDYSGSTSQSISAPPMSEETLQAAHNAGIINITR